MTINNEWRIDYDVILFTFIMILNITRFTFDLTFYFEFSFSYEMIFLANSHFFSFSYFTTMLFVDFHIFFSNHLSFSFLKYSRNHRLSTMPQNCQKCRTFANIDLSTIDRRFQQSQRIKNFKKQKTSANDNDFDEKKISLQNTVAMTSISSQFS